MNTHEQPGPTPDPTPAAQIPSTPTKPPRNTTALRDGGLLVLAVLLVTGGVAAYLYWGVWGAVEKVNYPAGLRAGVADTEKLAEGYTEDGDSMVSAPPKDAKELLDPEVIRLGVFEKAEKGERERVWKEFVEHLSKATGKKVELAGAPVAGDAARKALTEGELHVTTLSTGTVPLAVSKAGFVPFATLGDDKGIASIRMEVLAREDSPVHSLKDIKGRTIALGSFSSLTSFKAPVVVLWQEAGLVYGRDYDPSIVNSQKVTIKEFLAGKVEIVAVASDLFRREAAAAEKDGKAAAFRTIYTSKEDYPPQTFGYTNRLDPKLAAKVKEAFATFQFAGTGMESYAKIGQTRFVPVTYSKDFANVRAVDKALLELVGR